LALLLRGWVTACGQVNRLGMQSAIELFIARRNRPHLRGHKYVLDKQGCNSTARQSFVSARVINVWNNLPDSTDFRCLRSFYSASA